MKGIMIIKSLRLLALLAYPLVAQGLYKASAIGHSQGLLQPGASAGMVKTISTIAEGVGVGPGKIENGVNLLTGQPFYSISLGSITARTVGYPIALSYSGNTKSTVDQDNERAPTSWVGLGFNLTFPFVATNHKGTYTSSDDAIFCNLGPYGGGQILLDSAGTRYYVSNNPYIKVSCDTADTGEYAGQFTKWVFTFPDGKKMLFGQDTNAQRYVLYTKGTIKASPYSYVTSKKFIYRWDLGSFYDSIPNRPPKNILTFEYDRYLDSSALQKFYIREAYPKNIKWMEANQEVERYEFKTTSKGSNEYIGYAPNEPRDEQKIFETRRLDTLKCYKEGVLVHFYKFDWIAQKKGLLSKIKLYHPHPTTATPVQDSGWTFGYDPEKFFLLNTISTPSSGKDSLEYVQYQFLGTNGEQDPNNYVMHRADNITEIPLPSDTADLARWTAENTCDERFCYSVVWDGDDKGIPGDTTPVGWVIREKMYVEIKRNLGNHFDSRSIDSSGVLPDTITARFEMGLTNVPASSWRFIPTGDYVLLINEIIGSVLLYEYDGVRWAAQSPFVGDSRWNGSGFNSSIKVTAASNYFLVQKKGPPYEVIVAIRKSNGWTTLNRNSSICNFDNKGDYGESIRPSSGGCLEWSRSSLSVLAQPNYFSVVDSATSVLLVFSKVSGASQFQDISSKIDNIISIQMEGKPMNWINQIIGIYGASDYFLVQSTDSVSSRLVGFYFDGDTLGRYSGHMNFGSRLHPLQSFQVFTSSDYHIVADPMSKKILILRKKFVDGKLSFEETLVRNDFDPSWKLQVRTHPAAFTIEYYKDSTSFGLRPKWDSSSTNYHSYLYHVNRAYSTGYADRTSSLMLSGLNLFNTSLSGSDNMLVATHAMNNSNGRCSENPAVGPCTVNQYTARFHPDDTAGFINSSSDDRIFISINSNWKPMKQSHSLMSSAARLGRWLILDSTGSSRRIRYRQYQFDGKGFGSPDSQFVVNRIHSLSLMGNNNKDKVIHQFYYAPYSTAVAEFNSNLLIPQFEGVDVARVKMDFSKLGSQRTVFYLDAQVTPLSGKSGSLNGLEKYSRAMAGNGDTTQFLNFVNNSYRNPNWPKPLYVPRLKSIFSQSAARNLSRMADTTSFYNYCDTNGLPHFTLQKSGLEKIILSQSYFDALGFPKQSAVYRLFSPPSATVLETLNPSTTYSYSGMIGGSKSRYEGYYFQEDSLWREADQNLSDADLKAGTTPNFRFDEGWIPGAKVTQRDTANFFQVLETKVVKNKIPGSGGERHTSFFHEGRRSSQVATVDNAQLTNCAILLGENGNTNIGNLLDHRGKWENPGTTFSSLRAHTGRFSLQVTDNYGPTVNVFLKDVRVQGFGYRVSAWIYSDTGTPALIVERRQYNGSIVNVYSGAPVTGTVGAKGVWQRWEANLTYAQLTDNNLFNGNSDYLRIWIGTGASTGVSSRILYVDDIVCIPSNATFGLTTYDKGGVVTSVTDATHRPIFYDIGFKGQIMAIRDEKYRILGQGASHHMGEN